MNEFLHLSRPWGAAATAKSILETSFKIFIMHTPKPTNDYCNGYRHS